MRPIDPTIKKEITPLIEYSLDFAKIVLVDSGEFYPFGAKITAGKKTLIPVAYSDGQEFPESTILIDGLDSGFEIDFEKKDIIASCTTYDVRAQNPKDNQKTDAICIKVRHVNMKEFIFFFYPYELTNKQEPILGEPWATD